MSTSAAFDEEVQMGSLNTMLTSMRLYMWKGSDIPPVSQTRRSVRIIGELFDNKKKTDAKKKEEAALFQERMLGAVPLAM